MDQHKVFYVVLPKVVSSHGFVGYGTVTFGLADFDNLLIEDGTTIINNVVDIVS